MAFFNSSFSHHPLTGPSIISYPDCNINVQQQQQQQPEIPPCETKCGEPKKLNWLRYILACCFLLTCAAFITFLVLFIIAVSGGMGQNAGRINAYETIENDATAAGAGAVAESAKETFNRLSDHYKKNYDFFKKI